MEREYQKNFYVEKAEDIAARARFDENGFAQVELLPGVYNGGIKSYQCFLKAGKTMKPELYADKSVVLFFGKGEGELTDCDGVHKITEVAFYVPFMDKETYEIHAVTEIGRAHV